MLTDRTPSQITVCGTASSLTINVVFSDVKPCKNDRQVYTQQQGALNMEVASVSKTLVLTYYPARFHIPEAITFENFQFL